MPSSRLQMLSAASGGLGDIAREPFELLGILRGDRLAEKNGKPGMDRVATNTCGSCTSRSSKSTPSVPLLTNDFSPLDILKVRCVSMRFVSHLAALKERWWRSWIFPKAHST